MVRACDTPGALDALLADARRNALLVGPAGGTGEGMRAKVTSLAATGRALVLDADALTSFAGDAAGLARLIAGKGAVITPHEGEFKRLFSDLEPTAESVSGFPQGARPFPLQGFPPAAAGDADAPENVMPFNLPAAPHDSFPEVAGFAAARHPPPAPPMPPAVLAALQSDSKLEAARRAARLLGAVVVLKGPDTVIAAPDGRAAINANAPPTLATAGSGDVLAGLITGLLAQGMPAFEAAAAGVWMHGAAAALFGPGLIADDLPALLPRVLAGLDQAEGFVTPLR
jgi:NAD(P)H-hydrate repair Nnr-like enzyme with NAD(P)H-hydrate dehydratase domain